MVMIFCQHTHNTCFSFGEFWLNVHETPHYKFLKGDRQAYINYLNLSWKGKNRSIEEKISSFENLLKDIQKNGVKEPIQFVKRFNGDEMVFHGNHRYAVCKFLNIDCPKEEVSIEDYIRFNIENKKNRFGTNDQGIPYQSVFYRGECIIEGRRKDQLDRHSLIDPSDLRGKRVYDFGCNMGASCILAHESGAKVEGWDLPDFRTTAIRLALLMNYDIRYVPAHGQYDTLFLFSVHAHTRIPDIKAKVVYVETHEDGKLPACFKGAKKMGTLGKRTLWRYENC